MKPTFRHDQWREQDGETRLLRQSCLDALTGAVEYQARVKTPIGQFKRMLCEVRCLHPEKDPIDAMADTVTGSLYVNGRCLSGPLQIVGRITKTGRRVPGMSRRGNDAGYRASNAVSTGVTE